MDNDIVKRILTSVKCRACGHCYEEENIKIFGHKDDMWLIALSCPACETRYLAIVNISVQETKPLVITTGELTSAERDKFNRLNSLTDDEADEMRNFLKDFEGDARQLFDNG